MANYVKLEGEETAPPSYQQATAPPETNPYADSAYNSYDQGDYDPVLEFQAEHLQKGEEIDYTRPGCNDAGWAVFFLLHCAGIVGILVAFRSKLDFSSGSTPGGDQPAVDRNDTKTMIYIALTSAAIGLVAAWGWVLLMKRIAGQMIKLTGGLVIILHIFAAAAAVFSGFLVGALVGAFSLLLFLFYACWVQRRIALATVMLEVSSTILERNPQPIYIAFGMIFVSAAWTVVWSLSTVVLFRTVKSNGWSVFAMLVSFYWSGNVAMNLILVTASGVAATWYFSPLSGAPTKNSFLRASTTSFGSICFGSFIIAVVQALRVMVNVARRQRRNNNAFVMCLVGCILSCLESIVEYVNTFAFVRVAIYGVPYWQAAKETWQLFKARGFDILANDDLTGWVLRLGAFIGGLSAALVGGFWAAKSGKVEDWGAVALFSFLIALFVMMIVFFVIKAYIITFFVASAEDPETLRENHPEVFVKFTSAIREIYGDTFDNHFQIYGHV
eukprot:54162_1